MPKVSICIPTYKQVEHLEKTLNSVLEQNFTDYEIIISDDSPDDSVEKLIGKYKFQNRVNYQRNPSPLGSPANWNKAIEMATGEYIKILHHDDFFKSNQSLEKFVWLLDKNPTALFAFSGTEVDLLQMKVKKNHFSTNKQFDKMIREPESLFFTNYIGAPSAVIIRNSKKIAFDTNLKWLVDVDWYIQLIRSSEKVVFTQEQLICTIHGAEGQVTQAVQSDKEIQIKEHIILFFKLMEAGVNRNKFSLFFQVLFNKYAINSLGDLNTIHTIPDGYRVFFEEILRSKSRLTFFKKLVYWLSHRTLKDHLFTLKTNLK